MSISVDDLVASLSSNHIGQEAMDLAALQAQLQTLFCPTSSSSQNTHAPRHSDYANSTPTARTPTSASFCWDREPERRRSNSVAGMSFRRDVDERDSEHSDAMEEDERMVEDMLCPATPATPTVTMSQYPSAPPASPTQYTMRPRHPSGGSPYVSSSYDLSPSNSSLFATTDPFYLAQLQAAQTPSFFAQYGNPSQQSPFLKGHSFQGHTIAQHLAGTPC